MSVAVFVTLAALAAQDPAPAAPPPADTVRQVDVMDLLGRLRGKKPQPSDTVAKAPGPVISILPVFGANPTVGVQLGVAGNVVYRMGPAPGTRLSTLNASVTYTTKKQFNVVARTNLNFTGNRARLEGDWRYLDTNQPTYGLGPAQPEASKDEMDFKLIRLYETGYLAVDPNVQVGVGYHLDHHFEIVDHNAEAGLGSPFLDYSGGLPTTTTSSGFSLNAAFDSRDSPVNASGGYYASSSLRVFPTWLGSDQTWQAFIAEGRGYFHPSWLPRGTLAVWTYAWASFGQPPYLDLPAIGWDYANRMGRGYAQGRIRSRNLVYGEAEYRVQLSRNGFWGAVGFMNFTAASDPVTGSLQGPDLGGGVGLRIKLNKHSNTNITIDAALGAEGSGGVFLGTGEVF